MVFGFFSNLNPLKWFGRSNGKPEKNSNTTKGDSTKPTISTTSPGPSQGKADILTSDPNCQLPSVDVSVVPELNRSSTGDTVDVQSHLASSCDEWKLKHHTVLPQIASDERPNCDETVFSSESIDMRDLDMARQDASWANNSDVGNIFSQSFSQHPDIPVLPFVRGSKKRRRSSSPGNLIQHSPTSPLFTARKVPRMGISLIRKTSFKRRSPSRTYTPPHRSGGRVNIITNLNASMRRRQASHCSPSALEHATPTDRLRVFSPTPDAVDRAAAGDVFYSSDRQVIREMNSESCVMEKCVARQYSTEYEDEPMDCETISAREVSKSMEFIGNTAECGSEPESLPASAQESLEAICEGVKRPVSNLKRTRGVNNLNKIAKWSGSIGNAARTHVSAARSSLARRSRRTRKPVQLFESPLWSAPRKGSFRSNYCTDTTSGNH